MENAFLASISHQTLKNLNNISAVETTETTQLPCVPMDILTDAKKKTPHTILTTLGPHFPSLKMSAFAGKVSTDSHFPINSSHLKGRKMRS